MNVALVHDSFTQSGGAERVVDALHEMFPKAPVYTLVFDQKLKDAYRNWDIRTSWLQVLYNFIPRLQYLLPFIPLAVYSLKFDGYDVVISSSSSWAKNIHVPKGAKHICYCHTPTRFLWIDKDYVDHESPGVLRPIARIIIDWMRSWDIRGAGRVSEFIANSQEVQKRIREIYHRDSVIIHPFVDLDFWHRSRQKQDYFLLAGRLQAHKNNEFVVQIFNELGLPLHVVGTGRQEKYLRSIAKSNIKFFGRVSDEVLRDEYSGALGFVYPQLEDFGLMPLEAAACGTATLAYGKGGSLETVKPGVTGELFAEHGKELIKKLVLDWKPERYPVKDLTEHAANFSKEKFKQRLFEVL